MRAESVSDRSADAPLTKTINHIWPPGNHATTKNPEISWRTSCANGAL
jgi:hypothetical protein